MTKKLHLDGNYLVILNCKKKLLKLQVLRLIIISLMGLGVILILRLPFNIKRPVNCT